MRWQHPKLGRLPPSEFISIAEETGLIVDLGLFGLERTARQLVQWQRAMPGGTPIFANVNVSSRQLLRHDLIQDIRAVLSRTTPLPGTLKIELTESLVMENPEHAAQMLERIRELGAGLALDDFGTGHSSLAHLTRLPLDILKLDRAFVNRVDRDPKTRALCESVVAIGKALGLDVVAEGVETPAQLSALRGLGCGFAQGSLRSRPLRPGGLAAVLTDGAGVLWPGLVGTR